MTGQAGERQMPVGQGIADDGEGLAGGVAIEQPGQFVIAELVTQGPAKLAEQGIARQRGTEG